MYDQRQQVAQVSQVTYQIHNIAIFFTPPHPKKNKK